MAKCTIDKINYKYLMIRDGSRKAVEWANHNT